MTTFRKLMMGIGAMLLAAGGAGPASAAPQQMPITFAGYTNRSEVLTNFPVLVVLSNNVGGSGFSFADFVTTNGYDLRFVTNATSMAYLNYEIESWNTNAGQASYVWVQVPTIPGDGSGSIWAKWGDTANSNQLACTTNGATWTNGYVGVWHLPDGTTLSGKDSSTSGQTGTIGSGATATNGVMDGGGAFDGTTNGYVQAGTFNPLPSGTGTASIWVNWGSNVNSNGWPMAKGADFGSGNSWGFVLVTTNTTTPRLSFFYAASGASYGSNVAFVSTIGSWHLLTAVMRSNRQEIYVDGALMLTNASTTITPNAGNKFTIGKTDRVSPYHYAFKGLLDEARVATAQRSTNWVWAEYVNMASNGTFNACGALPPQISVSAATNVTLTSACLNGTLVSTGASATAVSVYWGPTDCGTNGGPTYWANTNPWPAPQALGSFTTNVTGLASNTIHFYRYYATNAGGEAWADPVAVFMTGEVGIHGVATNGAEQDSVPVVYSVYRSASCTNAALLINYAVSGTASNGVDYPWLSGSTTIPAGATNVSITVPPYHDQITNEVPPETVILTLAPGPYLIGAENSATGTIADSLIRGFFVATNGLDTNGGTSLSDAWLTLSNAVAQTHNGDLIQVTKGTYTVTGSHIVITNAITLQSLAGATGTVLQASGAINVLWVSNTAAVVDGFTIRNGNPAGSSTTDGGGGIFIGDGTVRSCLITNNTVNGTKNYGGGVALSGGRLVNSIITRNTVAIGGSAAYGAGVYIGGTGIVENCTISYNSIPNGATGGGGGGGGVYMASATAVLRNCLVYGNAMTLLRQGGGGGVGLAGGTMLNCTIARNYSTNWGGGVFFASGAMTNCIIYNNLAGIPFNDGYSDINTNNINTQLTYAYSDSPGLTAGIGNINTDPRFADPGNGYGLNLVGGDFHLQWMSPCIDSGTNLASVTGDLTGTVRPLDGNGDGVARTDMGCYEMANAAGPLACDFSATNTVWSSPFAAVFTGSVSGTNTNSVAYAWDFDFLGNPGTMTGVGQVVTNTYTAVGYYTVKLTAVNAASETAIIIKTNYIRVGPTTTYVVTNGTPGLVSTFPYTNWTTAATNVLDAVNALAGANNLQVFVSNGTYAVTSPLLLNRGIHLSGGPNPSNTVIRQTAVNCRVVTMTDPGAFLDGVTVTNGWAYDPTREAQYGGGGIYIGAGTVSNCVVLNNRADGGSYNYGGGVSLNGGQLLNSTITSNYVGSPGFGAYGGGVYIGGNGVVQSCVIFGNYVAKGSNGGQGGAVYMNAGTALRNCLVAGNGNYNPGAANTGGGVYMSGGTMLNCTMAGNFCTNTAGGVYYNAGGMTNSIVYGNLATGGNNDMNVTAAPAYCDCPDLTGGTINSNKTTDPKFVDPGSGYGVNLVGGDFHLQSFSLCIDVGINLTSVPNDLTGTLRPLDGNGDGVTNTDMGCYEMTYAAGPLVCDFLATNTAWSSPFAAVFTGSVLGGANNSSVAYTWDFDYLGHPGTVLGDGQVVTNTYTGIGYYTVKLMASNAAAEIATMIKTNYIRVGPTTTYVVTNGTLGLLSTFPYTNWTTAATNVLDAVNALAGATNLQVFVSNGTYTISSAVVLDRGIHLTGGPNPTNTVIRQTASNWRVVTMTDPGAFLDGVTVCNGYALAPVNDISYGGGGIYLGAGTVSNCLVLNSQANGGSYNYGGGVLVNGAGRLLNSTIASNYVGTPGFGAYGGGVYIGGSGVVQNCVISGNYVAQGLNAGWGGGVYMNAGTVLRNCLVAGNGNYLAGYTGGGVYMPGGTLQNCTITRNFSTNTYGGVYWGAGGITNCIVYANLATSGTNNDMNYTVSAVYSCCPALTNGLNGNITNDPLFRAIGNGYGITAALSNYTLSAGSPCINKGTNQLSWMTGALDLSGNPRIIGPKVDMGAYEWMPPKGAVFIVR